MAFPCFSVGSQGEMLTVHRTPFLMNLTSQPLFLVQEKPREEETGEMGTTTRT